MLGISSWFSVETGETELSGNTGVASPWCKIIGKLTYILLKCASLNTINNVCNNI